MRVICAWQAQYLVKVESDCSWQAQHFVTFWEIAGARNVVFFHAKSSPRWDESGHRGGLCEMAILSSDYLSTDSSSDHVIESSLYWRKQFRDFLLKS